jgi:hypothetical protein
LKKNCVFLKKVTKKFDSYIIKPTFVLERPSLEITDHDFEREFLIDQLPPQRGIPLSES